MKIGIFGGSFNPPHKMHESIAKQLIERKIIDKVIFVPTSNFYPKAGLISDEQRYEMLSLMIKNKKEYSVSDYEFGRLTYTYQTLEYFKNENKDDEIYFICGSDNLEQIDTWREYEKILGDYKLVVIPRKHNMIELLKKYDEYKNNIIIAELDNNYLSSTLVREYLKEKKYEKVKEYISNDVLDYIIKNNLYL
ncbi:MAG: nicotinate (nicotinamide) nucleotide adenylyltransferase [Bacilli bacterium]|nr:nicotinate (nicotinamide) nucleotide adenylyltransferase [Bacilli bacterium]